MKTARIWLVFLACLATFSSLAQNRVEVYPDDRMMWSEILFHSENGAVREGNQWKGEVVWTLQPGKIFSGYSSSSFDLAFTIQNDQLIQGDSQFSDAILYTLDGPNVYIGDSKFPLDLVYTLRPSPFDPYVLGLFKEDSISTFDRVCVFKGIPSPEQFFALLLAQGLI